MNKRIDINIPVAELAKRFDDFKAIMAEAGFKDITSPAAMLLMGRVVTIKKGSAIKGISLQKISETFARHGYQLTDGDAAPVQAKAVKEAVPAESAVRPAPRYEGNDRQALLKNMIERVSSGESVDSVRQDFVRHFEAVDVSEIIQAEQGLMDEGMAQSEVQKLCDLHSALFHGRTAQEVHRGTQLPQGHPIASLKRENEALEALVKEGLALNDKRDKDERQKQRLTDILQKLRAVRTLYGKKEVILMPVLYRRGVTGPTDVMWGVDDEIKGDIARLAKTVTADTVDSEREAIDAVLARMKEMIYKEENIFFPLCMEHIREEEWFPIYADLPEMGPVFVDGYDVWPEAEDALAALHHQQRRPVEGVYTQKGGALTYAQLDGIFKNMPIDVTFVDENDINRFFANEGRVFARPLTALGRKVYDCHPKLILPMVKKMIADFKSGARDRVEVWTPGRPVRVIYAAIRDENGSYLGTAEYVQNCAPMQERYGKK